ncbi:MAG TPA: hypothetical protein VMU81_26635 [Acetobacteraceae bacterium]|nr:hypothetical protein [Acetobacteraceae bacterium]
MKKVHPHPRSSSARPRTPTAFVSAFSGKRSLEVLPEPRPLAGPKLQQAVSALGPPAGVRVWSACGRTDMREGIAAMVLGLLGNALASGYPEQSLLMSHLGEFLAHAEEKFGKFIEDLPPDLKTAFQELIEEIKKPWRRPGDHAHVPE